MRNPFSASGGAALRPANPVSVLRLHLPASTPSPEHVNLTKGHQRAGVSLSKRDLTGIRAQVALVVDCSGSMGRDFRNGNVATLIERVLAFAMQVDVDGVVPVIPFASTVKPTIIVGQDANPREKIISYRDVMDHLHAGGTTDMTGALKVLRDMAKTTKQQMLGVVVGDGEPDNQESATRVMRDLTRHPVFMKMLAFRDNPWLDQLDNSLGGLVDNVNSKTFADPSAVGGQVFADAMVDEWDAWMRAATAAGVLLR